MQFEQTRPTQSGTAAQHETKKPPDHGGASMIRLASLLNCNVMWPEDNDESHNSW